MSKDIANKAPLGSVNIYGCGGAGCKTTAKFYDPKGKVVTDGVSSTEVFFIDTSHSDLPKGVNTNHCLILSDKDGSGRQRGYNVEAIKSGIRQAPELFKPADLNIVVYSDVGGSGSVIGPLLAAELVAQDQSTVCLVIGSNESLIAVTNALNTLATLDGLSLAKNIPLLISYLDNGANTHLDDVNEQVEYQISILAALANRQHVGLDKSDLRNFFQFSNVGGVEPQVGTLHIRNSSTDAESIPYPVATASLVSGPTDIGRLNADYQCVGIMADPALYGDEAEHHFIVSVNVLPEIIKSYSVRKEELLKRSAARPTTTRISSGVADKDGMVV